MSGLCHNRKENETGPRKTNEKLKNKDRDDNFLCICT